MIPGHEIVGTVVRAGPDVKGMKVGDRVGIGAQIGSCFECPECKAGWQQHCRKPNGSILTYNSKLPDGQVTQGGYADHIRLDHRFAFHIPNGLSSSEAAPLLCGGVTVYAPLSRGLKTPGMKVGVIGIGGLGHLAVKFAAKLLDGNLEVTAISQSNKKREAALAMGAHKYLDMSDDAAVAAHYRHFDYVICTVDGKGINWDKYFTLMNFDSTFCIVGVSGENMNFNLFSILGSRCTITTSGIGSIDEIKDMLSFAEKHHVIPILEHLPMSEANVGLKKVRDGTARFRVVLENKQ